MANYQTPGVYIEEIASLPGTIVGVPTAIPCFIGYTELHDKNVPVVHATANTTTYPVKVSSLSEYERLFGGPNIGLTLQISALGSGATPADWVLVSLASTTNSARHLMHPALQHYFMNGGGPCYIVSLNNYKTASPIVDGGLHLKGITASALADEVTLMVMPDAGNITTTTTTFADVAQAALAQCAALKDRFVLLDVPGNDMVAGTAAFRSGLGTEYLSYGAAYGPRLETSIPITWSDRSLTLELAIGAAGNESGTAVKKITLLEVMQLIADNPAGTEAVKYSRQLSITNLRQYVDSNFASTLPSHMNLTADQCYRLPPSAAIAGLYARTDRERAVWITPANIAVSGVKAVAERFTPSQLDGFNVPTDGQGKSINVIRTVQGRGHLVMGARTLLGNSLEWRYVSVRRTFLYIEESISLALAPIVFEPNDFGTWNRVRTMVSGFLADLWRQGALMGKKPEEAFFVKVGLGSTMTPEDILAGKLVVEIGIAAVRPAEFIILRFSHLLQQG